VLSLYAKGLTTGEIQAHLVEIYDAEVSRETISRSQTPCWPPGRVDHWSMGDEGVYLVAITPASEQRTART
jgi:hypothetical protein